MKIKFLSPVNAGAKVYAVGDVADMPKPQASELIACGAAEVYDPTAAKAEAEELVDKEAAELLAKQQGQA